MEIPFNFGAAIMEGIVFSLFLGLVSKKKPGFRVACFALFIIAETAFVVMRYSGQENSTYFFAHPYLAFFITDISDLSTYVKGLRPWKEALFEKAFLWPVIIIPIMSAFVMTTGWLIKLYLL